jgi:hypothetical protein
MNLYAITADHSPSPADLHIFPNDAAALDHAIFVAAYDAIRGDGSPSATVWLVARDVAEVGRARATQAPPEWAWAHPGVEQNEAMLEDVEREFDLGPGAATGLRA